MNCSTFKKRKEIIEQIFKPKESYKINRINKEFIDIYRTDYKILNNIMRSILVLLNEQFDHTSRIYVEEATMIDLKCECLYTLENVFYDQQILVQITFCIEIITNEKLRQIKFSSTIRWLSLISQILIYQNNDIMIFTLKSLSILLQSIDYYSDQFQIIGDNSKVKLQVCIMIQLNIHNIQDKLLTLYKNVNNKDVRDLIDECVNILDKIHNEIENY